MALTKVEWEKLTRPKIQLTFVYLSTGLSTAAIKYFPLTTLPTRLCTLVLTGGSSTPIPTLGFSLAMTDTTPKAPMSSLYLSRLESLRTNSSFMISRSAQINYPDLICIKIIHSLQKNEARNATSKRKIQSLCFLPSTFKNSLFPCPFCSFPSPTILFPNYLQMINVFFYSSLVLHVSFLELFILAVFQFIFEVFIIKPRFLGFQARHYSLSTILSGD